MRYQTVLYNLERRNEALSEYQKQMASGKRINKSSDDPFGADSAHAFRQRITMNEQYQRNIENAEGFMGFTDNTLDSINTILMNARSTAIQADNDNLQEVDRLVAANEINQDLEDLLNRANTQFAGKYIFGGFNYDVSPFTAERDAEGYITAVVANEDGIDGMIDREIGMGIRESINVGGTELFQQDGQGDVSDMFQQLITLRDACLNNQVDEIGPQIEYLTDSIDHLNFHRASIGERVNYMQRTLEQLQADNVGLTEGLETVEDVDLPDAVMNFELEKNAYTVALQTGGEILQLSLLNFI